MWYKGFQLFPRVGIVTSLEMDSREVVRFYNKRGTAERWIKEGKQAVGGAGMDMCLRIRLNSVISDFFRTRGSQSWPLPGPLDPLRREK